MASDPENDVAIYPLPNLMTAGNLFCGFLAVIFISKGRVLGGMEAIGETSAYYTTAIQFIFGACVFDLLDGRVARISGQESAFGREFDSLADVVAFGLAPALLLMDIVLFELRPTLAQILAFIYLLSGTMRLARFNCVAAMRDSGTPKDFNGVPIPAAAGFISSVTLAMLYLGEDHPEILGKVKYLLLVLMLLVSYLMFSNIKYPSFKNFKWSTKRSVPTVLVVILIVVFTVNYYEWMPAVLFTAYLIYGMIRPSISKRWRGEIEVLEEDDDEGESSERPSTS